MAAIINNYATDLPRVDVKGESHTAHIKSIGDSYGYNVTGNACIQNGR